MRHRERDEQSVAGMPGVVRVVVRATSSDRRGEAVSSGTGGGRLKRHVEGRHRRSRAAHRSTTTCAGNRHATRSWSIQAMSTPRWRARRRWSRRRISIPYQMHGSLGTSCAVADVQRERATVWSSTQSAYPLRSTVAILLGLRPDNVRVVFTAGSGCYGINGADTVAYDAALLSQAVGRPVRVQLSRQDEMAWENYGFAYVIDQRAGVDRVGDDRRVGLRSVVSVSRRPPWIRNARQRRDRAAGGLRTGVLPADERRPRRQRFANSSNAAPSYVTGCAGGTCGGTGTIKRERVLTHTVARHFSRDHCVRRVGCRTPSRTNASSTRSRRMSRWIPSHIACVIFAIRGSSKSSRRRRRRRTGIHGHRRGSIARAKRRR